MISDEEIAKNVSDLMLEFAARLNASTAVVRDRCPTEEFHKYRRAVGQVMGDMLLEIMNPIYQRHPKLKPARLR
jgi:hypothetical protein